MAWLGGWSRRIKLTADQTKIDTANQLNFPVLAYLSAASGIGDVDVSCVFDELTSDANRKKIAVTTSDGVTECYVEIERWDDANEKAWLWIKVPSVAYDVDTDLYLYYDKDHADNTSYVGDIESTPARNVWDNNFVCVLHLGQDPNGDVADAIKDSTSNTNHGTPGGTMTSADLVDGKIGKAIDFDGSDDRVVVGDAAELRGMAAITIEGTLNIGTKGNYEKVLDYASAAVSNTDRKYRLQFDAVGDQGLVFVLNDSANAEIGNATIAAFPTGTACYLAGVYTGVSAADSVKIYKDGSISDTGAGTGDDVSNVVAGDLWLAGEQHTAPHHCYDGVIDEFRTSNIARTASWIKATYHSNWDSLITYGTEQLFGATGNIVLPALSILGSTGIAGEGDVELPSLSILSNTGAIGDVTLPALNVLAEVFVGVDAQGNVVLPGLETVGFTGARCNYNLPSLGINGVSTVGIVASGEVVLPIFNIEGQAFLDAIVDGTIELPTLRVNATSIHGSLCIGEVVLPGFRVHATAKIGTICTGCVTLPCLIIEAKGGHISIGEGNVILPLLQVYSNASILVDPRDECHILRYSR